MGLLINGVEVTRIELGGVEVMKIEDSNGTVLYEGGPAKDLTLKDSGYGFAWSTSDGRSGTVSVGDPDYTLTISSGQTVTFTTPGGKDRLTINGADQCNGDSGVYTYAYQDLSEGDIISCEHFSEAC